MRCPKCSCERSSVVDSRSDGVTTRRRRECQECNYRFSTHERIEYSLPLVVKKDGGREAFSLEKLRGGIMTACEKRPVAIEEIDFMVESVQKRIQEACIKELPSRQIGDFVMEVLLKADKIAYVRFASVYREFSDVNQFVDALEGLGEEQQLSGGRVGVAVGDEG